MWPPWGQSIQRRTAKGMVMDEESERVNDPGRASTTTEETDGKKIPTHLPGRVCSEVRMPSSRFPEWSKSYDSP